MSHPTPDSDQYFMQRALSLAERGVGLCAPNPLVGCVLAQGEKIVGEGWHEYDRRDHAEIVALQEAGALARGATAYLTLEPCSHTGRTGPCAKALIDAGIRRVLVATSDPNPLVAGRGIAMLRSTAIEVSVGLASKAAEQLNHGFAHWIQTRLPFVTLKVAMTLDGRIAPGTQPAGEIFWITGPEARQAVQSLRHASDAILTGIGTVLADDPQLNDRSGRPRRRPLLRVVVDSELRLPLASKLAQSARNDVLVVTVSDHPERRAQLEAQGLRVAVVEGDSDGRVNLLSLMRLLGEEQIQNLLVESGTALNTALLKAGLVDAMHLFMAPRLLGGDALPAFAGMEPLALAPEFNRMGDDFHLHALLRNPWPTGGN
jgi:diaminohydroxyphosphoribosylaminopyrimidine deaminase/5-amino-6-(5-phosphoribosylamino)uracil reductase